MHGGVVDLLRTNSTNSKLAAPDKAVVLEMSSNSAAAAAAAAVAAFAFATLCCWPSAAFLPSRCNVLPATRVRHAFASPGTALGVGTAVPQTTHTRRRSRGSSSGDGFKWAPRTSGSASTTPGGKCHERSVLRQGGLLMSLDGGGDESNALLLRMDFELAEVEELREWIRR